MTALELAIRFGAAGGLGLVLGLERERSQAGEKTFAGVRSYALIALLGAAGAFFHTEHDLPAFLIASFLAVTALVTVSYYFTTREGQIGATTEFAALITFAVGCLCGWGDLGLAAGLGVGTLFLLSIKGWSHDLAKRIVAADVEAALKFAIISIIILPLLPNRVFGPVPLNVLNPYKIWLMVVLISGLNFASYVLVKVLGQEHGIGLTGILGGLVSSTAVTLGFSQRSRKEPALAAPLCLGILLAWTVMFFRVPIMVAIVNPDLGKHLGLGLGFMAAASLGVCGFLFWRHRHGGKEVAQSGTNPFELSEAIKFGLLFGVVTFVAKAAQVYLGDAGLYLAGALAGLTDVDAISLSMANLAGTDPASAAPAARTILIAVITNTLVKAGMAVSMGSPELRKRILPIALLLLGAGIVAVLLVG
jgi:uncharacterized membrane protein (DUF4010 family)